MSERVVIDLFKEPLFPIRINIRGHLVRYLEIPVKMIGVIPSGDPLKPNLTEEDLKSIMADVIYTKYPPRKLGTDKDDDGDSADFYESDFKYRNTRGGEIDFHVKIKNNRMILDRISVNIPVIGIIED